jgi:hypothetical protein
MAKVNNTECHLKMESFEILRGEDPSEDSVSSSRYALGGGSKQMNANWTEKAQAELSRYKMLFDGIQMTRLTILTWLTYIFDFWGFTVAGISTFPKPPLKRYQLTRYDRLLSTPNLGSQERRSIRKSQVHICRLHIHIRSWNSGSPARLMDVSHP